MRENLAGQPKGWPSFKDEEAQRRGAAPLSRSTVGDSRNGNTGILPAASQSRRATDEHARKQHVAGQVEMRTRSEKRTRTRPTDTEIQRRGESDTTEQMEVTEKVTADQEDGNRQGRARRDCDLFGGLITPGKRLIHTRSYTDARARV